MLRNLGFFLINRHCEVMIFKCCQQRTDLLVVLPSYVGRQAILFILVFLILAQCGQKLTLGTFAVLVEL